MKVTHRDTNLTPDHAAPAAREINPSTRKRPSWGQAVCAALLCGPAAATARVLEPRGFARNLQQAGCGGPYPGSDPMGGSAPAFDFGATPMTLRRISTERLWVSQACHSAVPEYLPATSITYGFQNQPGPWSQLLEPLTSQEDVAVIKSNLETLSHAMPNFDASSYATALGLRVVPAYYDTPANLVFLQTHNSTVVDSGLPDWIGISPGEYYQNNVSVVVKVRETSDTVAWRAALGTALGLIGRGASGDDGSTGQAGAFPNTTLSSLEFTADYASDAGFGPLDMQALGSKYGVIENTNEVLTLRDSAPTTGAIFGSTNPQNQCYMSPSYKGNAPLQVSMRSGADSYTHVGGTVRSLVPGTYCDNAILSDTNGGTVFGSDRDNFIQGSSYSDTFVLGSGSTVVDTGGDGAGSKQIVLGHPNTFVSIQNGGVNDLQKDTLWFPLETALNANVNHAIKASGMLLTAPNNITVWAANWQHFNLHKQVRPGLPKVPQLPLPLPDQQGRAAAPAPALFDTAPAPAPILNAAQLAVNVVDGAVLPRGSVSTAVSISNLLPPQLFVAV